MENALIFWILSVLIFLFGLLLMAAALLGANRSPFPKLKHPGLFWWPALGSFVVAVLVALFPLVLAYGACERACDVIEGGEATEEYNKRVAKDFDNCVKSQQGEAKKRTADAGGTAAEIKAAGEAALPDAQYTCRNMVVSNCISACYMPAPKSD